MIKIDINGRRPTVEFNTTPFSGSRESFWLNGREVPRGKCPLNPRGKLFGSTNTSKLAGFLRAGKKGDTARASLPKRPPGK